ncbi:MAG: zinc ABC transporter substrate-binding protein [Fibrobacteraceae bacterium]|nr:zinc ABC transporter substrate-binding protein [Fibrobacteraceae bacterium]
MNKLLAFLLLFVLGCASFSFAEDNKVMKIATSVPPYAKLVKDIGGVYVDVNSILPPSADPHTYEPKPAALKEFSQVQLYFSDGSGMDKAWLPRFKGVNKNMKVVNLAPSVKWIEENGDGHDHELDPHVWTSPWQMRQILNTVLKVLSEEDPAHKSYFMEKFASLSSRLDKLDKKMRFEVIRIPRDQRSFIVFHPAYGYFARDYKMEQIAVQVNGKEPKPKDLQKLIRIGKERNIHIVFVQPQFNKRSAETIAKELDAVIVETDPMAYNYMQNSSNLLNAISDYAQKSGAKNGVKK